MDLNLTRGQRSFATWGAAAVFFVLTVYWASRPEISVPADSAGVALPAPASTVEAQREQRERRDTAQVVAASAPPGTELQTGDTEVATVAEYTTKKYQFLLEDLGDMPPGQVEQLRRLLLERELLEGSIKAAREAGDPSVAARESLARQEAALAKVEEQIRGILRPADHATYVALKDSDLEQFHLNEYAGGVSNVAPLSEADRKAILKIKLAYKARFRQLVADSGLLRDNLSPAEREYAYSVTARALEDYRRSYLQEVRQYLSNEEQFILLSNYETTEFTAELDRLRSRASGG